MRGARKKSGLSCVRSFWEYGRYARLRRWLYGMRRAAAGWEEEYAGKLEGEGFRKVKGAPTVFFNAKTAVRLVVHGDDFTYSGDEEGAREDQGGDEGVVRHQGPGDDG